MRLFYGVLLALLALQGCAQPGALKLPTPTPGAGQGGGNNPPPPTSNIQPTRDISGATSAAPPTSAQPDSPTSVPTFAAPTAPVIVDTPLPTLAITPRPQGAGAWAALKVDATRFDAPRTYIAPASTLLWWYDPVTAQFVALGWVKGSFEAQGQFRLRGQWVEALEVPYQIDGSYGISLDPGIVERIRRAGYTEPVIETFIYLAPDLVLSQ